MRRWPRGVHIFESIQPEKISPGRRAATVLVSLFLHITAVLLLVVIPLIYFNVLPQPEVITYLMMAPPPPAPPPAPPPRVRTKAAAIAKETVSSFTVPTEIPKTIPPPGNEPVVLDLPDVVGGAIDGVPGGIVGGIPGGIPGSLEGMLVKPHLLPPPPPPPREVP